MIHSPSNRSTSKDPSWNEERVCPFLILKLSIFIYLIVLCETEHYRWVNLDSWKRYMAPEIMRRGKFHEATILASLYESDVQKQSKYLLQTSSKLSWRGVSSKSDVFVFSFAISHPDIASTKQLCFHAHQTSAMLNILLDSLWETNIPKTKSLRRKLRKLDKIWDRFSVRDIKGTE